MKAAQNRAVQLSFMARQVGHIYKPKMPSSLALPCYATMATKPVKEYKVLSIDGGGVRGIIPARILTEIEKRTGKPISQLFDYVGGTSTGGILSLGLLAPTVKSSARAYKAEELLELYQKSSNKIFHTPTVSSAVNSSLELTSLAILLSLIGLWYSKDELIDRKDTWFEYIKKTYPVALMLGSSAGLLGRNLPVQIAFSGALLLLSAVNLFMLGHYNYLKDNKLIEELRERMKHIDKDYHLDFLDKEPRVSEESMEAQPIFEDAEFSRLHKELQKSVKKVQEVYRDMMKSEKDFLQMQISQWEDGQAFKEGIFDASIHFIFFNLIGVLGFTLGAITRNKSNHLFMTKHNHQAVEALMKSYFGEAKLSSAMKDVMVTSYDVKARLPVIFSRDIARTESNHDVYTWEAARATSAAPTYFNPYKRDGRVLVDGGIFVNNPSALMLANVLRSQKKENVFFVSLGTGVYKPVETASFDGYGLMQWGLTGRIVRTMMEASSDAVDMEMQLHLGPENYKRLQLALHSPVPLDDSSKETIAILNKLAEDYIKENSSLIDEICQRLLNGPGIKKEQASSQAPVPGN